MKAIRFHEHGTLDVLRYEDAPDPAIGATAVRMRQGEAVRVWGRGSGVASAAIQIAKLFHCRVISTAGSDEKLAKARDLGADETINHSTQDITAEVKRLTGKRGVDVVFEHVGQATWTHRYMSIAAEGRYVTCDTTTAPDASLDLRYLFSKNLQLI